MNYDIALPEGQDYRVNDGEAEQQADSLSLEVLEVPGEDDEDDEDEDDDNDDGKRVPVKDDEDDEGDEGDDEDDEPDEGYRFLECRVASRARD